MQVCPTLGVWTDGLTSQMPCYYFYFLKSPLMYLLLNIACVQMYFVTVFVIGGFYLVTLHFKWYLVVKQ